MDYKQLETKIALQHSEATRISNLYDNLKREPQDRRTNGLLLVKQRTIQKLFQSFQDNHNLIYLNTPAEERKTCSYLNGTIFSTVDSIQEKMEIKIEEWLEKNRIKEVQSPAQIHFPENVNLNQPSVRLPQITIEKFTGDYRKWASFKNYFETLIHNKEEIQPVEKFYHLKSNLSGEPIRLIDHYVITAANYESAWTTLKDRYDNKRVLVNMELKCIMQLEKMTHESSTQIRKILDTSQECLNSLRNLNIDISTWDPILIFILIQKLDQETHRHYENSLDKPRDMPKLDDFITFLENRFQALENVVQSKSKPFQSNSNYNRQFNSTNTNHNRSNQPRPENNQCQGAHKKSFLVACETNCELCNELHPIYRCPEYNNASTTDRLEIISRHELCSNCLGKHDAIFCGSSRKCRQCSQRHHTSIHDSESTSNPSQSSADQNEQQSHQKPKFNPFSRNNNYPINVNQEINNQQDSITQPILNAHSTKHISHSQILLATALVDVTTLSRTHTMRCLIDQGSQSSFITENAAQLLQLKRASVITPITGLGAFKSEISKHLVSFQIQSKYNPSFTVPIDALVISKITNNLPSTFINIQEWIHLNGIELADPTYYKPNKIDILLGADAHSKIIMNGLRKADSDVPIAQQTELGWVLSGHVENHSTNESKAVEVYHQCIDIDNQLKEFWTLEDVPNKKFFTEDENECERIFQASHKRDKPSGRFIVALPFKNPSKRTQLGKSKYRALTRFTQLENRLAKNESLR